MPDFIDTFTGTTLKPEWANVGSPTKYVDGQLHIPLTGPFDFSGLRFPSDDYATTNLFSDEYIGGNFREGYLGFRVTLPAVRPEGTELYAAVIETNRSAFSNQADSSIEGIYLFFRTNLAVPGSWTVTMHSWLGGGTLAAVTHDWDPTKPHYLMTETADRSLVLSRSADGTTYENVTTFSPAPWLGYPGPSAGIPAATDIRLELYATNGTNTPVITPYEYVVDNLAFHWTRPEVTSTATARWNVGRYNLAGAPTGGKAHFAPVRR